MKNLLILFSVCSFLFGCGASQEVTPAKVQVLGMRSMAASLTNFSGGLVLYGKSGNIEFSKILSDQVTDAEIPNGTWNFYVMGWHGASDGMSGTVFCGKSLGVELSGEAVDIILNATNADCADSAFGTSFNPGTPNEIRFPDISFSSCSVEGFGQFSSFTSMCEYKIIANGVGGYKRVNHRGAPRSYKVIARSFNNMGAGFAYLPDSEGILESACTSMLPASSDGRSLPVIDLNIPAHSAGIPLRYTVKAYYGSSNCDDNFGHFLFDLIGGTGSNSPKSVSYLNGSSEQVVIATKMDRESVCSNNVYMQTLTSSSVLAPFRSGNGTPEDPFVICDIDDIDEIDASMLANSFYLGSHLVFDSGAVGTSSNATCSDYLNSNFKPIGYNTADCTAGAYTSFRGQFDGAGRRIEGLRLDTIAMGSISGATPVYIGFIPFLADSNPGTPSDWSGTVFDIIFKDIEFKTADYTGLIGNAGQETLVANIDIDMAFFTNKDAGKLASLVGDGNGEINHINANGIDITATATTADVSQVGGIIGALGPNGALNKASFSGRINTGNAGNSFHINYVGGVAGLTYVPVSEVSSKGNPGFDPNLPAGDIISKGYYIGGVIGAYDTGYVAAPLEKIYSRMHIESHLTSGPVTPDLGYIAGLVGVIGAYASINTGAPTVTTVEGANLINAGAYYAGNMSIPSVPIQPGEYVCDAGAPTPICNFSNTVGNNVLVMSDFSTAFNNNVFVLGETLSGGTPTRNIYSIMMKANANDLGSAIIPLDPTLWEPGDYGLPAFAWEKRK